jgi:hypothetical protein
MNWYSVGLAGLSGGLAALIGTLIFRNAPAEKNAQRVVIVILFVVFGTISKQLILPKINAYQAKADVAAALKGIPAFASIQKTAPDTYRKMSKVLMDSIERGESQQQATALVRAQLMNFLAERLPHASDAAIVNYVGVMGIEMGELQAKGNGLCHQFLFPQVAGGVDITKLISKETQMKDLAALDEIVKTSNSKRPKPPEKDVIAIMQPMFASLQEKHGDSVSIIQNPTAPGVDKEKVCSITRDLYQKVAALPVDQAGLTLRWMFAQN